jgi:hypothetical protein
MELLPAIVGLAVVDSINPSALLATVALLLRGRRARPLVAVYLVAVLTTYFATGVVLILGFGLTPWAVIESDAAYLAQGVLGAAMLAYALAAPAPAPAWFHRTRKVADGHAPGGVLRRGDGRHRAGAADGPAVPGRGGSGHPRRPPGDGVAAAAGALQPDLRAPPLLLAGLLALGKRADVTLGRLRDRLGGAAREGFLWLLGLIGFFLLADALGHFQIIG